MNPLQAPERLYLVFENLQLQSPPGPEVVVDGTRYFYFGGTNDLGLAGHPEVIKVGSQAFMSYGIHSS